jgi:hypothetical protein
MHTISEYAEKYRLRMKRDRCGDLIVPGKLGHLYEHGSGRFGMVLEDPADGQSRARGLLSRCRKALAAGFTAHQAGDAESILLFDPESREQSRLAIRLVGARAKRQCSPAQLERLRIARESRQDSLKAWADGLPVR